MAPTRRVAYRKHMALISTWRRQCLSAGDADMAEGGGGIVSAWTSGDDQRLGGKEEGESP